MEDLKTRLQIFENLARIRQDNAFKSIIQILNTFEPEEWEEILGKIEFVRQSRIDKKRFLRTMKWLGKKYFKNDG